MSASALRGRRVEASRAGMRTTNATRQSGGRGRRRRRRLAAERARLAFEHHRDAVAHRKGQPVGVADELLAIVLRRSPMLQRPLAERTDEQVKQASFHADRSVTGGGSSASSAAPKPGSGTKSSRATQTRVPIGRVGASLIASFSVRMTSRRRRRPGQRREVGVIAERPLDDAQAYVAQHREEALGARHARRRRRRSRSRSDVERRPRRRRAVPPRVERRRRRPARAAPR